MGSVVRESAGCNPKEAIAHPCSVQRCVSADDVERAVDRAFELQRKTLAGEQPESRQSFRLETEALKAAT